MKKTVSGNGANPVQSGMSDIEAGDAFASYMDAVDGDLSIFEQDAPAESSPSPKKAKAPESAATDTVADAEADDAEEEELSAAASDEDDDKSDDEEQGDETDAETETLESAQLAAALGVDDSQLTVDDDGTVRVRYKVDGEDGEATLQELVKGYQTEAHVTRKSQRLEDERRALRETTSQREQELAGAIQQAGAFGQVMRDRVLAQYAEVDWKTLMAEDPGRYSALNIQLNNELGAIDHEVQKLQGMASQQLQQSQQQAQQAQAEWIAQEQVKLYEHLPVLKDPKARVPVLQEFQTYLNDIGFGDDEIRTIDDHRLLRVVSDAVAGRKATAGKTDKAGVPIEKKLAKVPRVMKGGSATKGQAGRRGDKRKQSLTRLKKSGSDNDAARFAVESGLVDSML